MHCMWTGIWLEIWLEPTWPDFQKNGNIPVETLAHRRSFVQISTWTVSSFDVFVYEFFRAFLVKYTLSLENHDNLHYDCLNFMFKFGIVSFDIHSFQLAQSRWFIVK